MWRSYSAAPHLFQIVELLQSNVKFDAGLEQIFPLHNGVTPLWSGDWSWSYPISDSPPDSHNSYQRSQPHPHSDPPFPILPCVMVIVGVIFFTTIFVRWYPYRSQLPEFRVDSFSLSNLTFANGSRMSFIAEIKLAVRNPSEKVLLSYDHVVAATYYEFELLSQTGLASFSQEAKNETSLVVKFAGDGDAVEKWVVDGINGEIGKNGSVVFDFRLGSWIKWESKSTLWHGWNVLKVFCGDLVVGVPSNGMPGGLTGLPRSCRVGTGIDDDDSSINFRDY